jgi:hypothetical protein
MMREHGRLIDNFLWSPRVKELFGHLLFEIVDWDIAARAFIEHLL